MLLQVSLNLTVVTYTPRAIRDQTAMRTSDVAFALSSENLPLYPEPTFLSRDRLLQLPTGSLFWDRADSRRYMGSPKRNSPVQLAVDPGGDASSPAGVYYAATDGRLTTFFRAFCGGNRSHDEVLRTYGRYSDEPTLVVSSLHILDGSLFFTDSNSNRVWKCDKDMKECSDLHVNKILTPNLLATHVEGAGASEVEHAVYADAWYSSFYTVPLPGSSNGGVSTAPAVIREVPAETMAAAADLLSVGGVLLWRAGSDSNHVVWKMEHGGARPGRGPPTIFLNASADLSATSLLAIGASLPQLSTRGPVNGSTGALPRSQVWLLTWHADNPTTGHTAAMLVHRIDANGRGLELVQDIYPFYKDSRWSGFPFAIGAGSAAASPNLYFLNPACSIGVIVPGKDAAVLQTDIGSSSSCSKALKLTVSRHVDDDGAVLDLLLIMAVPSSQSGYYGQRWIRIFVDPTSLKTTVRSGALPGTGGRYNYDKTAYTEQTISTTGAVVFAVTGLPARDSGVSTRSGLTVLQEKNSGEAPHLFCSSLRVTRAQPVMPAHPAKAKVELRFVAGAGDTLHASSVDGHGRLLHSIPLDTANATVDGMAVDLEKELVFWRHGLFGDLMISHLGPRKPAGSTDIVVQNPVQWPADIVVDPGCEFVYWSDIRLNKIMRIKLDGSAPAERVAIMPYPYYSSYSPVAQLSIDSTTRDTLYYTWAINPQSLYAQSLSDLDEPPRTLQLVAGYGKRIQGFQATAPDPATPTPHLPCSPTDGMAISSSPTARVWFGRYEWDPQVSTFNVVSPDPGSGCGAPQDRSPKLGAAVPGFSGITDLQPSAFALTGDIGHCFSD